MDTKTGFEGHYLNEESADVHFICRSDDRQSDVRVPAHKIVLASKSETFQAMFYGSLPEKGDVPLPLLTATAFKEFLQLFYFTQVGVTMDNVNDVVDLSKKYQSEHGLSICGDFLKENLSNDNFITVYELALLYELTELKSFCEISAPVFLSEEDIVKCTRTELKHILQIKQLYVDMNLIDVCVQWAQNVCEERQIGPESMENIVQEIGDLVECFDFASMPQSKIEEVLDTFDAVLTKDTYKKVTAILMKRGTPLDVNKILWVAKEKETNKRYIEPTEVMTVITNKTITVRAVGFAPIYWEHPEEADSDDDIYGQLVILQDKVDNGNEYTVLLRESFNLDPFGNDLDDAKTVQIQRFERSVVFEPNQMYKLQVQLMIRKKDEIFCRSKLIAAGKHKYNRSSGDPTEIMFDGNSTIASLGIGIEYIDMGTDRLMMIDETK
ncbi:BTB/POZ domain-containing protein 6-A-like [Sitodiplosis mosellana]|uniref:BTB/POZ domain-containing protein 6-A-like n=1 Tax=Sitodiplosis mosellana TaxID=263140 RepID=UPI0024444CD2|nr:BTB/POZ domain-containing protein 6-A-like [Sitodiplosis mosellana]